MSHHNLTDLEWKTIRRVLPKERTGKASRPWKPHRQVIKGIMFALRAGNPWLELPPEFGVFKTVYVRFRRWGKSGVWLMIVESLTCRLLKEENVDFELWWATERSF